jgi:mono/diheme cytochrome c family protein
MAMRPHTHRPLRVTLLSAASWLAVACGGVDATVPPQPGGAEPPPTRAAAPTVEVGPDGPTALVVPSISLSTDPAAISRGEALFGTKGCAGCHQFGSKLVGPDLNDLLDRRTVPWVARMILHPGAMVKTDPVAKDMFRSLMVEMPNQGVTEAELADLLAYLASKGNSK